jgi:glucosylceramidase
MERMILRLKLVCVFAVLAFGIFYGCAQQRRIQKTGEVWLTNPDGSILFSKQEKGIDFANGNDELQQIRIDENQKYQSIDGFGFTLTGGSASHLINMSAQKRSEILKELFATTGNGIGTSYLRLSIGASDLNATVFSYDDLPEGQTDLTMQKFNLGPDTVDVIPVLREILAINPEIRIMGSPWSPPAWMKTVYDTRGGSLKPEFYDAYAKYFVRYVTEMKTHGIHIDAITVQNEPLHPGNNPSLLMPAADQAVFVKKHLGPAFRTANIDTKIIVYDHNADRPDYPISILNDQDAKQYIDGSAFHLYGGNIEALTEVHNAHPDKNLYFTEQWIGAPGNLSEDLKMHIKNLIIGAPRNWSKTVLQWNLASDPQNNPHTDRGGCDRCLGGITIDKDIVTRNPAYYIVAHAAKFVRPGSKRIASDYLEKLPNVAFKTPDNKTVLIVYNDSADDQEFAILYNDLRATSTLKAGAVGTYVW